MRLWKAMLVASAICTLSLSSLSQQKYCLGFNQFMIDGDEPDIANATNIGHLVVCTSDPELDIVERFFGNDERFEIYRLSK